MARIERFEDIIAWQTAMGLCDLIYSFTNNALFSKDFALRDQIRKSAISVPSNISEGFERESNNQFIYFLLIAKASAGELRTQLYIAKNRNYISEQQFNQALKEVLNVSKLISGFASYLRERRKTKTIDQLSKLS